MRLAKPDVLTVVISAVLCMLAFLSLMIGFAQIQETAQLTAKTFNEPYHRMSNPWGMGFYAFAPFVMVLLLQRFRNPGSWFLYLLTFFSFFALVFAIFGFVVLIWTVATIIERRDWLYFPITVALFSYVASVIFIWIIWLRRKRACPESGVSGG